MTDNFGEDVIAQVEAGWSEQRFGLVVVPEDYKVLSEIGCNVKTVGSALRKIN